ncbi:MAG: hypothetical protein KKH93_04960 [Candidatus Omnitrophica bacterium]|nr:hypothetical protein [Candidatus Omnitrophota bacterium]MBU2044266.1 hypothetical protein [Candidatus Omnitrophota bacterium]MBU2251411.1 hypothetical protein [Candidatus Omnitrophota bacterium]MBU2474057.1 hypothetical protein [Candidatus Omnitrophota bacterium]
MKRKDFEIFFYENILKERPEFVGALISLGDAYTRRGLYQEGLAVDRKLADLRPDDPIIHYNLACSLSLVGNPQEALRELKKAILLGYDDFSYIMEDADLKNVRDLPEFKTLHLKLKKIED